MADGIGGSGLGFSNLVTVMQNVVKAIGQLNQTISTTILSLANTWTGLQTFSGGIVTNQVNTTSNLVLGGGGALATTATTGFPMIPSCAGTPTGVPTSEAVGKIAMVYDTTAHKLWFYDPGSATWKGVAVS